jgi:chaperonin GroEL
LKNVETENEDQSTGVNIVRLALEAPLRVIAENAGQEGSVVVNKVREGKKDYGYNARTNKYEEFFSAGIIDPTKVARLALENAASIAGLLLTTEAVVSEIPEKKEAPAMPPGGGMDGMM